MPARFFTTPFAGSYVRIPWTGQTLTPREADVLGVLLQGNRSKRIAYPLGLSPKTVSDYKNKCLRKTGYASLLELVFDHTEWCRTLRDERGISPRIAATGNYPKDETLHSLASGRPATRHPERADHP